MGVCNISSKILVPTMITSLGYINDLDGKLLYMRHDVAFKFHNLVRQLRENERCSA